MKSMRQIKFRYWDGFNAVMKYSEPDRWADYLSKFFIEHDNALDGDNDPVLMQFTGLLDKNGKEIWEGDILEYSTPRNGSVLGAVVWEQQACAFWFKWKDGSISRYKELKATFGDGEMYRYDSVEVIGNIYEQPDLLTTPSGG